MADHEQHAAPPPDASVDASPPSDAPLTITLQIVSPSVTLQTLRFQDLPAATTLREVKQRIRDAIPQRPKDDQMRLIHRGRLLSRDTDTLLDIFGQELIQSADQQTLHLALRDLVSQPAPAAIASQGSSSGPSQTGASGDPADSHLPPAQLPVDGNQYHHHHHHHPRQVNGPAPGFSTFQAPHAHGAGTGWPNQATYQQHAQHHAQHLAQHQNMVQWMDQLRHEATGVARWTGPREQRFVNQHVIRYAMPPTADHDQNQSNIMGYTVVVGGGVPANQGVSQGGSHHTYDPANPAGLDPHEFARITRITTSPDHEANVATQTMTDAMRRSASGASLANMATNLANANLGGVEPIQPGVTTPRFAGTPGDGTRPATPDPSTRAASASMSTSQPPQPSSQPSQPVPDLHLPESHQGESRGTPQVYMLHSPAGPLGVVANHSGEYQIATLTTAYPLVQFAMNPNVAQQAQASAGIQRQQTIGPLLQLAYVPPVQQRSPGQMVYFPQGYYYPPGYYPAQSLVQGAQLPAGQQRQPRQPLVYYPQGLYYPPGYYIWGPRQGAQAHPPYGPGQAPAMQPPLAQIPATGVPHPQNQIQQQPPHDIANPLGGEGLRFRGAAGQAAAPAAAPVRVGGGLGHRGVPVGWAVAGWTVVWHVLRFVGAIWWFSYSNPSWQRWVLFGACSLALLLANLGWFNGMVNNAFQPVRRHLEGLIGINGQDGQAQRQQGQVQQQQQQQQQLLLQQPQQQAQQQFQQGAPNQTQRQPQQGPNHRANVGNPEPDPENLVRRLIEERNEQRAFDQGAWLRDRARFLERALVLLIASLAPGVAERHIRQLEERERAERRAAEEAAERERTAQEAAANQQVSENNQGDQQQTEGTTANAVEGSYNQVNEGESPGPVDGAAEQPQQRDDPIQAHLVAA